MLRRAVEGIPALAFGDGWRPSLLFSVGEQPLARSPCCFVVDIAVIDDDLQVDEVVGSLAAGAACCVLSGARASCKVRGRAWGSRALPVLLSLPGIRPCRGHRLCGRTACLWRCRGCVCYWGLWSSVRSSQLFPQGPVLPFRDKPFAPCLVCRLDQALRHDGALACAQGARHILGRDPLVEREGVVWRCGH